jgi:hypothetical protein
MRSFTIIAAASMIILSVVSALTVPFYPSDTEPCSTCLDEAAIVGVPVTKSIKSCQIADVGPTDDQRACVCVYVEQ